MIFRTQCLRFAKKGEAGRSNVGKSRNPDFVGKSSEIFQELNREIPWDPILSPRESPQKAGHQVLYPGGILADQWG